MSSIVFAGSFPLQLNSQSSIRCAWSMWLKIPCLQCAYLNYHWHWHFHFAIFHSFFIRWQEKNVIDTQIIGEQHINNDCQK
jgi:hypothetical protein